MRCIFISFVSILFIDPAFAQETANNSSQATVDSTSAAWSFAASAYHYILPNEKNTTTFIGYADHKALHIEARYNYEDEKTASVFGGYRFEVGHKLIWGATPMVGFAFGNTNGIVPALEMDLTWKKFDLYSENEYVVDFDGNENNYFYTWSELAITPLEKFRTGISANRTRLYQTDLDIQRAVFAQYSFWKLTAGVHYFNPFTSDSFVIATLDIEF